MDGNIPWKSTSLPVPKGLNNFKEMAAIIAQKKLSAVSMTRNVRSKYLLLYLLHITLAGKKYDTSSKLNSVPPIGAPKATATPAAQAALFQYAQNLIDEIQRIQSP